jgi:hypothetical protein
MAAAISQICDPGVYRLNEAIQLANSSVAVSPDFESDLIRFLQAQCLLSRVPLPTIFRGLDVLGGMADGSRLSGLLAPFLESSDPRIAAKSTLVREGQSRSIKWLDRVFTETDDRVRANLIQSLWTRKEPEIEPFLRNAVKDRHPRVAANAVYGLYLKGSDAWIEGIARLIGSEDAAFRKSGIWVLKSAGVPDAPARIKLLIRDADAKVRRAAFDALIHLRDNGPKKPPAMAVPD